MQTYPLNPTRRAFSLRSFHGLFDRLATSFLDMATTHWQDLIRDAFALTPEQEASLVQVSESVSASMQQRFVTMAAHLQAGGHIQGRIIKQGDGSHQAIVYLHAEKPFLGTPTMLTIVRCDANCQNWEWFP